MLLPRVWSYKILRSYRILHHLSGAEREREREGSLLSVLFLYSFCLFVHMSYCDNSLLIFCGLSGECIYQYVNAGLHLAEFIGNGMLLCMFFVIFVFPFPPPFYMPAWGVCAGLLGLYAVLQIALCMCSWFPTFVHSCWLVSWTIFGFGCYSFYYFWNVQYVYCAWHAFSAKCM